MGGRGPRSRGGPRPEGGGPRCRIVEGVVFPKKVGGEISGGRGRLPERFINS